MRNSHFGNKIVNIRERKAEEVPRNPGNYTKKTDIVFSIAPTSENSFTCGICTKTFHPQIFVKHYEMVHKQKLSENVLRIIEDENLNQDAKPEETEVRVTLVSDGVGVETKLTPTRQ